MQGTDTDLELIERNKLHEIKFYEVLESQEEDANKKASNKRLFSNEAYNNLIEEIMTTKNTKTTKTGRQYYLLNTYNGVPSFVT